MGVESWSRGLGAESAVSASGLAQVMPRKTSTFQALVSHQRGLEWNILFILVIFDGIEMDYRATFMLGKCSELQPIPQRSFLFLNII